jgi:hypothetical protein
VIEGLPLTNATKRAVKVIVSGKDTFNLALQLCQRHCLIVVAVLAIDALYAYPAVQGGRRMSTIPPDLCTFRRSDSCVNSAANRGRAGMGLQLVDNTGISVHRILCTDLQEVTDTAIASGSRIFIGSQKEFCKAAMGAGFVLAARFQGNHAGDSRVSSSAVNSRRIQNGVHNSGSTKHDL